MMAEERRARIAAALAQCGVMSIGDITAHVGCSVATARRDLDTLARLGRARRTRGGALAVSDTAAREDRRDADAALFAAVKRRIAHAAAALVEDGDTVGLTGGTTMLAVARHLRGRPLGLVTNALDIARELAAAPGAQVVLIGGVAYAGLGEIAGPLAEGMLRQIRVDALFLSVDGVSAAAGATITGDLEAPVVRAFVARARRTIVVADHRKIGRTAVSQVLPIAAVAALVTDAGPSPARAAIEGAGVRVITV